MIRIGNYEFMGPYDSVSHLEDKSGVYAILGRNLSNEKWSIVDIGESATVQRRVANHDRKDSWMKQGYKSLRVAVLYERGHNKRYDIEQELRRLYKPPCGER